MDAKNRISERNLSKKYDELYADAEKILRKRNPCRFSQGKCRADDVCCDGCRHLAEGGCQVNAISCKLWLCFFAKRKFPTIARQLNELVLIAKELGFLGFRETKEEVIRRVLIRKKSPYESQYW